MKTLTDEQLRQKLGDYVAPQGLYQKTKNMPFLGKVTCNVNELVAGSWHEIVLDYEVGASGIADGAWIKATFKFYSDWGLFQTSDPQAANYVSAEYHGGELSPGQSPATVQSLKVRFDQKGHERPFQKAVIVDVVDGFIKPGDHIVIRLGDRRAGGPGTRVQTFVEKDFAFRCYIDPLGTSRFAAIPGDITMDIVAGPPTCLAFAGPRAVKPGEKAALRIRAEDQWGNTCWNCSEQVQLEWYVRGEKINEQTTVLNNDGWAVAKIEQLPEATTGELEIRATLPQHPEVPASRFYITYDNQLPFPRSYFGDLHVHSDDTVGTNDTVYNLTYGRDVAGLDVLGYTANDFQITKERWNHAVELCNELNVENEFVCYPGTEWCGNSCAGGDHNVVFLHDQTPLFPFDNEGNVCRSFEWNEDMNKDVIQSGAWPLEELWATYAHDPEGHLLMPHVGGRRCNLDWHHPQLERLVEIESAWGHFPWLYEETMRRGYKLGASANGDEHRGRCGGGVPGTAVFGTKGGVTGIIANTLNRQSIGQALRARHTWATTGERLVGIATCGSYLQGDEFSHKGNTQIAYRFLGDAGWDEITAFDHSGCFYRRNLQQESGFSERRIRVRWGGARIKDRYRWAEWKGTISVVNGVINDYKGYGFEHGEETCWRTHATEIGFRSDTYGDADAIEIDLSNLEHCTIRIQGTIDGYVKVGDPLKGNPFEHCPEFCWEVSGKALMDNVDGIMRKELGGAQLFLAVERMSDKAMPRDLAGTIDIEAANGPHGFRPVYLAARQIDDAKVWTSAMFITFT
ncbi:MAG: hypothetical protein LJE85_05010 [Gammaproteobacteria bacterium]|jgi:hypothetical protein|nr:hypothetical protein [Gammaproteobacteria bacterium]